MKKTEKEMEALQKIGAEKIKSYDLVNNYGYTFEIEGKRYDARYWANCYGVALNIWSTIPLKDKPRPNTEDEQRVIDKVDTMLNQL